MYQPPFVSFIEACSLDTDACSTATSTRGSRPMRLPSEIACATPQASISEARGLGTREKICSLVMPGEAIATPCEVHNTPIERGDEQSRQLTMHLDDRLVSRSTQETEVTQCHPPSTLLFPRWVRHGASGVATQGPVRVSLHPARSHPRPDHHSHRSPSVLGR